MNASIAPDQAPFRVLVVDDNQDAADSLALLLKVWGCEARAAYDGRSGLSEALAFHPHCFILDIGLPHLDGYALARRLRETEGFRDAKLIALTAYSGKEHEKRVREAGFDYHLIKPAHPTEIERIITMLQQVMDLAKETKDLIVEAKEELKETKQGTHEVKEALKEVKQELREVKEEVKDLKEILDDDRKGG